MKLKTLRTRRTFACGEQPKLKCYRYLGEVRGDISTNNLPSGKYKVNLIIEVAKTGGTTRISAECKGRSQDLGSLLNCALDKLGIIITKMGTQLSSNSFYFEGDCYIEPRKLAKSLNVETKFPPYKHNPPSYLFLGNHRMFMDSRETYFLKKK